MSGERDEIDRGNIFRVGLLTVFFWSLIVLTYKFIFRRFFEPVVFPSLDTEASLEYSMASNTGISTEEGEIREEETSAKSPEAEPEPVSDEVEEKVEEQLEDDSSQTTGEKSKKVDSESEIVGSEEEVKAQEGESEVEEAFEESPPVEEVQPESEADENVQRIEEEPSKDSKEGLNNTEQFEQPVSAHIPTPSTPRKEISDSSEENSNKEGE